MPSHTPMAKRSCKIFVLKLWHVRWWVEYFPSGIATVISLENVVFMYELMYFLVCFFGRGGVVLTSCAFGWGHFLFFRSHGFQFQSKPPQRILCSAYLSCSCLWPDYCCQLLVIMLIYSKSNFCARNTIKHFIFFSFHAQPGLLPAFGSYTSKHPAFMMERFSHFQKETLNEWNWVKWENGG